MSKDNNTYSMPNIGCLIGTTYQTLCGRLSEVLKREGLDVSVPDYLVLRALYMRDGMQQCEIGDLIGKDKSAICRTVSSMAKRGLVRTEQISHKCLRVYLSDYAKEIRGRIMAVADERHNELRQRCTPEEIEVFGNVLRKLIQ